MFKAAISLVLVAILAVGCQRADERRLEHRIFAMGTWVDVIIDDADPQRSAAAVAEMEQILRRYEGDYYAWTDGELAALNAALADGVRFEASLELSQLLATTKQLSAASLDSFEPGLAPLVSLWGFNEATEEAAAPPAPAAIASLVAQSAGIASLTIEDGWVSAPTTALALDLGGIAKGAVVDYIVAAFNRLGIEHAMINAGGDLRVIGHPAERSWRVGIQAPRDPGLVGVIALSSGEAAFTSGDYERYYDHDGERMHHILDPATGYPVTHTQALTVIAGDGVTADAAATALFVAGPAKWRQAAENLGIRHVFRVDATGTVEMTAEMRDRLQISSEPASDIIPADF